MSERELNSLLAFVPDLASYDTIIVAMSGGKDSIACVLHLLELGVPKHKLELWHHDVDGREGSNLMDWFCTPSYCQAFADHVGLPLYFSWKVGGFEGELDRKDTPTQATVVQVPVTVLAHDRVTYYTTGKSKVLSTTGPVPKAYITVGGEGEPGSRGLFPMAVADLKKRWCSAYVKIDVMDRGLKNQDRFRHSRTLVVTGERGEESVNRDRYQAFERHRADGRLEYVYDDDGLLVLKPNGEPKTTGKHDRHIDVWRPVLRWPEQAVWASLERWRINPHPAYRMGYSRVSCSGCIFLSDNGWASHRLVNPDQFGAQADKEQASGKTIAQGKTVKMTSGPVYQPGPTISERADRGTPYAAITEDLILEARDKNWALHFSITVDTWVLPAGAYGEAAGPN